MASIKLKFRPSTCEGGEGSLYYQVTCGRTIRQVITPYKIYPCEWSPTDGEVVVAPLSCRFDYLEAVRHTIRYDLRCFYRVAQELKPSRRLFTADTLVSEFRRQTDGIMLFGYMDRLVARYKHQGQYRTSETYATTLNCLKRFRAGVDVRLDEVDVDLIESYQRYLRRCNLAPNTISFYLKHLRAVYRRAVDDGLVQDHHPFRRVSMSMEKTAKRALALKTLRRLKALDLSHNPVREFARDMFLFSFYTRGMSFVDMAYLQKRNLKDGVLSYRRRKTNQLLAIRWEPCMQDILKRYSADASSPYLLSIIKDPDCAPRRQYANMQSLINHHLKVIGSALGLTQPLTMYCARHSWASIAHEEHIPISVISEGMGHDSERTTQIYIASLKSEVIDKANRKILRLL